MAEATERQLARQMVSTLPAFGHWANGFRDFETPHGKVGFRQLAILWVLRHNLVPETDRSPTQLAAYYHVQPSVVTRALDKLEAAGFLHRARDPKDRRRFRITMTDKGREVSEYVEDLYIQDMLDSMSFLDDDQLQELRRSVNVLGRIANDLEGKRLRRSAPLDR